MFIISLQLTHAVSGAISWMIQMDKQADFGKYGQSKRGRSSFGTWYDEHNDGSFNKIHQIYINDAM